MEPKQSTFRSICRLYRDNMILSLKLNWKCFTAPMEGSWLTLDSFFAFSDYLVSLFGTKAWCGSHETLTVSSSAFSQGSEASI